MKQTIEIEVPDGKKAVWKDNKVIFEDIEPQLPKTWEEFCKQNKIQDGECYLDGCSKIKEVLIRERLDIIDKIVLPNKQAANYHLALMQLHQLRDCYRQGWIPNWKDSSIKYTIIRNIDINDKKYRIVTYSNTSHFLSFSTRKLAEEFLTNFYKLIEQAGDLI